MQSMIKERGVLARGVSDRLVQSAIEKVRAYLSEHLFDTSSDLEWWGQFERFFTASCSDLSERQRVALEIATDTMLVHAGVQSWSLARAWLEVTRRQSTTE